MKLVTVSVGICVILAASVGEATAGGQKSHPHNSRQACTIVRKNVVASGPFTAAAQPSSNRHVVQGIPDKRQKTTKAKTAVTSKFNSVSAIDQRKPTDDPTWAPIDVSDLNHLTE
ncbi:MAG TPA: hypothetical protein V6D22_19340 [Candidatus Obscuribacterales bacterium]